MNDLLNKINDYENFFIYGCGRVGSILFDELIKRDLNKTIRFCDINAACISRENAEVLSPEDAASKYPNALFILASTIDVNRGGMAARLSELGVDAANVVDTLPQIIIEEDKRLFKTIKHTPRKSIGNIEYHITEHCNLNCAGCMHFSNVANEEFADLQLFISDMSRLSEILRGNIESVHLLGGEPLLHPNVAEFMIHARAILPNAIIYIQTNGILLNKMPESFWDTVRENNLIIKLTEYPIKLDMDAIRKKAEAHSVRLTVMTHANGDWNRYFYDLDGKLDPLDSFLKCPISNCYCVRLYKGRLYPCTAVGNAEHFNRRFNQNLVHTDKDSIDIYSDVTAEDIFYFLANPVPFCRYCDMNNWKLHQPWSISKNDINEFVLIENRK